MYGTAAQQITPGWLRPSRLIALRMSHPVWFTADRLAVRHKRTNVSAANPGGERIGVGPSPAIRSGHWPK
jgi:hypothetical protein